MHTPTPAPRARSRAQLSATGITIERGGRLVLDDVSLTITPGTRLGVVGENGRGKSTLLHILAGTLEPDAGTVRRIGSLGLAQQEITTASTRTVGELIDVELVDVRRAIVALDRASTALADGRPEAEAEYTAALDLATVLDAWDADRRVDLALVELGATNDRDRLLAEMSVGERYRVRLACLLGARHDFLLLDEPTNHLDQHALDFLTGALRTSDGGVALVSHDRVLLADVATEVLDLDPSRDGRPRRYGNGYDGYRAGRSAELARWTQEFEEHRAEHDRLANDLAVARNRLQSAWRPPKGTGKHQRATRAPSLVRAVHRRLEGLDAHAVDEPVAPLRFRMPELPRLPAVALLRADGVTVAGRLTTPVSVELSSGDRLLVTGPNGAGKTTLLRVLAGDLRPSTGDVVCPVDVRLGLVAQEPPSAERRSARLVFESRLHRLRAEHPDAPTVPLSLLGLLAPTDLDTAVSELSLGQQRRLDLALALAGSPHVLLLDEPTNHVSIALVDELTEALTLTPAAVVLVTHDRQLRSELRDWPALEVRAITPTAGEYDP